MSYREINIFLTREGGETFCEKTGGPGNEDGLSVEKFEHTVELHCRGEGEGWAFGVSMVVWLRSRIAMEKLRTLV